MASSTGIINTCHHQLLCGYRESNSGPLLEQLVLYSLGHLYSPQWCTLDLFSEEKESGMWWVPIIPPLRKKKQSIWSSRPISAEFEFSLGYRRFRQQTKQQQQKAHMYFPLGPGRMIPAKKDGEKTKGHSANNVPWIHHQRVYYQEYISVSIEWASRACPSGKQIQTFAINKGSADVCMNTRLNTAAWCTFVQKT